METMVSLRATKDAFRPYLPFDIFLPFDLKQHATCKLVAFSVLGALGEHLPDCAWQCDPLPSLTRDQISKLKDLVTRYTAKEYPLREYVDVIFNAVLADNNGNTTLRSLDDWKRRMAVLGEVSAGHLAQPEELEDTHEDTHEPAKKQQRKTQAWGMIQKGFEMNNVVEYSGATHKFMPNVPVKSTKTSVAGVAQSSQQEISTAPPVMSTNKRLRDSQEQRTPVYKFSSGWAPRVVEHLVAKSKEARNLSQIPPAEQRLLTEPNTLKGPSENNPLSLSQPPKLPQPELSAPSPLPTSSLELPRLKTRTTMEKGVDGNVVAVASQSGVGLSRSIPHHEQGSPNKMLSPLGEYQTYNDITLSGGAPTATVGRTFAKKLAIYNDYDMNSMASPKVDLKSLNRSNLVNHAPFIDSHHYSPRYTPQPIMLLTASIGHGEPRQFMSGSGSLQVPFNPQRLRSRMSSWSLTSPSNETTTALIDPPPAIKNIGKRRGELAVEPVEGLDRSPAVVGRREVSKLSVSYKTKKYDDQQRLIDGAGAIYRYPHEMDWNNRDHVKKLNAWREQIHRRTFDQKRKTRPYWIEAEKAAVIELLGQHLQERAAVSKFDPLYKRVANVYNTRYHGRLQFAGHRLVADSRARAGGLLDKDRPAPWRTASALLGVSKKWPELTSMLGRASGEVRQHNEDIGFPVRGSSEGGSDDEEIPNPDNSLPSTTFSSSKKSAKHVGKVAGIPINLGRGNHRGGVVCDWAAAEGRLADGCDHDGDFFKDDTEWERANKRLEMEAGYESSDEEAIIVPGSSSRVSNSYVSAFIT